jgi:hypothetical protein
MWNNRKSSSEREKSLWGKSTWFYKQNMKRDRERCMVLYFDPKRMPWKFTSFTTMRHDGEYILLTERKTFSGIKIKTELGIKTQIKKFWQQISY